MGGIPGLYQPHCTESSLCFGSTETEGINRLETNPSGASRYSPKGHGPALRLNRSVSAFLPEATMADGDRVDRPQCLQNSRPQGGTIPLRPAAILMITLRQNSLLLGRIGTIRGLRSGVPGSPEEKKCQAADADGRKRGSPSYRPTHWSCGAAISCALNGGLHRLIAVKSKRQSSGLSFFIVLRVDLMVRAEPQCKLSHPVSWLRCSVIQSCR